MSENRKYGNAWSLASQLFPLLSIVDLSSHDLLAPRNRSIHSAHDENFPAACQWWWVVDEEDAIVFVTQPIRRNFQVRFWPPLQSSSSSSSPSPVTLHSDPLPPSHPKSPKRAGGTMQCNARWGPQPSLSECELLHGSGECNHSGIKC